jgi:hypothetical protein
VSHQLTYTSGGRQSQIDYTLYRRKHLGEVKDCKVVPGECVSKQHHVVITKFKIQTKKRKSITKSEPKILLRKRTAFEEMRDCCPCTNRGRKENIRGVIW